MSKIRKKAVYQFIYREARLIDDKQFDDWYALFTDDALYWMPLKHNQTEGEVYNSLFYEDKLMLKIRIERLKQTDVPSQMPPSYCQHVLQQPHIESLEDNQCETRTPFIYVESQMDNQFILTGTIHHQLIVEDGGFRIQRKRIELLNRKAALPSIQLFP
ncbi:MAG: aromatic-ring-hydroxylating dioxygenase subunit beta [Pseudomonadota bacterium]